MTGTKLQPMGDREGLRGQTAVSQPSLHPGTLLLFPLKGMKLGRVERSNFKGRDLFTVLGDSGETNTSAGEGGRCGNGTTGSSWLKFATKSLRKPEHSPLVQFSKGSWPSTPL